MFGAPRPIGGTMNFRSDFRFRPIPLFAVSLAVIAWTAAASAQSIVKIGEIEAQTGALNTYGWMSSQGMRMAVDEINKAGGFDVAGKKYKLELVNPDTQGNPQQARSEEH